MAKAVVIERTMIGVINNDGGSLNPMEFLNENEVIELVEGSNTWLVYQESLKEVEVK